MKPRCLQEIIKSRIHIDDMTGCWVWLGAKTPKGYGNIRYNKKYLKAHRASYQAFTGEIPKGMVVMHSCDNPSCVNPAHLSIGSNQDNDDDKVRKLRQTFGESHPNAKLTNDAVLYIRSMHGIKKQSELAAEFGVGQSRISSILLKKNWKYVDICQPPVNNQSLI